MSFFRALLFHAFLPLRDLTNGPSLRTSAPSYQDDPQETYGYGSRLFRLRVQVIQPPVPVLRHNPRIPDPCQSLPKDPRSHTRSRYHPHPPGEQSGYGSTVTGAGYSTWLKASSGLVTAYSSLRKRAAGTSAASPLEESTTVIY